MLFLKLTCVDGHSITHNAPTCSWRGLSREHLEFLGRESVAALHGCTAGGKVRGTPCTAALSYEVVEIDEGV